MPGTISRCCQLESPHCRHFHPSRAKPSVAHRLPPQLRMIVPGIYGGAQRQVGHAAGIAGGRRPRLRLMRHGIEGVGFDTAPGTWISWSVWTYHWTLTEAGAATFIVRATNADG